MRFPMSLRIVVRCPSPPKGAQTCKSVGNLACVRQLHYAGLITILFTFDSIDLKFVTSKNAVNADRIMKFIDENELNYI